MQLSAWHLLLACVVSALTAISSSFLAWECASKFYCARTENSSPPQQITIHVSVEPGSPPKVEVSGSNISVPAPTIVFRQQEAPTIHVSPPKVDLTANVNVERVEAKMDAEKFERWLQSYGPEADDNYGRRLPPPKTK